MRRLNIFALVLGFPRPDQAAGDRRFVALLGLLASRHRVDLFVCDRKDVPPEPGFSALRAAGVNVLPTNQRAWLNGQLLRRRYDLGLFELYLAAVDYCSSFRVLQPWAKVIVDTVDVHFARESEAVRLGLLDAATAATNRERELSVYKAADALLVLTEEDRRVLDDAMGMLPATYLVPIIIPIRPRPSLARRRELVFVGGFPHPPNVDGVLWFVRDIWPVVQARVPEAVLTIVGTKPPPEILFFDGRAGISVTGYVTDTAPYLDRAAVSIAPLRYGAGMKGKVTEALAAGVPVVTTSFGAQGFGIRSGEHAIIADEAGPFAEAIVRLLMDPEAAERIGSAGRTRVAELCTPEAVSRQLDGMLAELVPAGSRTVAPLWWQLMAARSQVLDILHPLYRLMWHQR